MVSPIAAIGKDIGSLLGVKTPAAATTINVPAAPALPPPATQPTAKPGSKGQQSSFLSGVAGSSLAGANQGQGATGKTLLGQ